MKNLVISRRVTNREVASFNQYLKDIAEIDLLTHEEEKELTRKTSDGDNNAVNELVKKNLRFVVSVAKQYSTINNPLEDLINEGNIGLIIAANKFKPEMGFKFISYAVWWVRKVIIEYLNKNGRLVRIPANKLDTLSKLEKKINILEQQLGRKVEISDLMDGDLDITEDENSSINDEYSLLTMLSNNVDSLDTQIDGDDGNGVTIGDMLSSDEIFKPTDYELIANETNANIIAVLGYLKPREQKILIGLYGLDGKYPRTLKDLGDELSLTREMVRQIKIKSLDKLKSRINENHYM